MSRDRQKGFAASLLIPGLLILIMGLGGSWGTARGQTGGQVPPAATTVAGVEGEAPAGGRPQAVAGESGEAVESVAEVVPEPAQPAVAPIQPAVAPIQPERRRDVAGELGVPASTVALIGETGADSGLQWPLLVAGLALLLSGSLVFSRARRAE